MYRIKRKRLIHCWDQRLINSDSKYTGFIFYSQKRCKVTDITKRLIHFSNIYLHNDKFPIINRKIDKEDLYKTLKTEFNIDPINIKESQQVYNIPNVNIYIIYLKLDSCDSIKLENYKWKTYWDYYTYDGKDDLYENILQLNNKHINMHVKTKIYPNYDLHLSFKLEQIYKFMIGFISVK